jgi:hypothetical protein
MRTRTAALRGECGRNVTIRQLALPETVPAADGESAAVVDPDGEGETVAHGSLLADGEALGDPQHWAFALYQASSEDYQETVLPSGQWTGTPKEALDCACGVHLAALGEH